MVHSSYKIYSNGTDGITLTEGNIADMEDSYNFLGILQADQWEPSARKGAIGKYLLRVRPVLRRFKMQAINS